MKEDIKTYKFNFHATIGDFLLNAPNISSPLVATWKRSSESVSSETVHMVGGKVNFNQTVTLSLNMYYDEKNHTFQDKKTMFTFNMSTPKGQKQAGVVYVEVAQLLNKKLDNIEDTYPLEKCPVKDSKVFISIVGELIGEGAASDTMSLDSSVLNQSAGPSTLSIQSKREIPKPDPEQPKKEETKKKIEESNPQKDKRLQVLQRQVKELKGQKQKLLRQLEKSRSKDDNKEIGELREELSKSKSIHEKLQIEIGNLRDENIEHERELQKMRMRMQQIYELLLGNLNSLY